MKEGIIKTPGGRYGVWINDIRHGLYDTRKQAKVALNDIAQTALRIARSKPHLTQRGRRRAAKAHDPTRHKSR